MKSNKKPLRFDLVRTLTIFIILVLLFIFAFQTTLTNVFYKAAKQNEIKAVTEKISIYFASGDLEAAFEVFANIIIPPTGLSNL